MNFRSLDQIAQVYSAHDRPIIPLNSGEQRSARDCLRQNGCEMVAGAIGSRGETIANVIAVGGLANALRARGNFVGPYFQGDVYNASGIGVWTRGS